MQSFLDDLANTFLEYPADKLRDCVVVLPSRRAVLYLKKAIAKKSDRALWLPQLFTFEDFITRLSSLKLVDKSDLLFLAFEVYKGIPGTANTDFDKFNSWAGLALSDFHDIDRYLLDSTQLFKDIRYVKDLEAWEPSENSLMTRFSNFWNDLAALYSALHQRLEEEGLAYQGMMYRRLAEGKDKERPLNTEWEKIWIAGLNALSPAEEGIIERLLESGKAEILWDADAHYFNNTEHEAGIFMRRFWQKWTWYKNQPFETVYNYYAVGSKRFQFVACDNVVRMCQDAAVILNQWRDEGVDFEKTAVVLADEGMLIPMMNALPKSVEAINITLGYALADTPVVDFLLQYLNIHESALAIAANKTPYSIYLPRLREWAGHVYFDLVFGDNKEHLSAILNRRSNFASADQLEKSTYNQGYWLGHLAKDVNQLLANMIRLCEVLYAYGSEKEQKWIAEQGFIARKALLQIERLLTKYPYVQDVKTLKNFIQQALKQEKLDLFGEPLAGLQILGMLETRALDFERVMIVGANEGLIPNSKGANSFIPYGVRMAYGLPTQREKDAIYMYHIYRLMQRAGEISLLYTTDSQGLGAKEKSRIIDQIDMELSANNKIEKIKLQNPPLTTVDQNPIIISKSDKHLERLSTMSYSPSSLNLYLECPVEFFYEKVLGLREAREYDLDRSQGEFGTVVHDSLEQLYLPFLDQKLSIEIIETLIPKSNAVVSHFVEKHLTEDSRRGMGLLMKEAAQRTVLNFLIREQEEIRKHGEPTIVSLEDEAGGSIQIGQYTIQLKGKIDRMDRLNGQLRIIDYKTGSVENFQAMNEKTDFKKMPSAQRQLLIYQWMVAQKYGASHIGLPVVVTLKSMEWKAVGNGEQSLDAYLPLTENFLHTLLSEILNKSNPFARNPEFKYAQYSAVAAP